MRRTFIVALLAALLLAGCRDATPREPDPSDPTSAAPSSSKPTSTPPTLPAQARKNTPEGAVAFVRHWISTLNYSINASDPAPLRQLSAKTCRGCQSYINRITKAARSGEETRAFKWTPGRGSVAADRTIEITVTASSFEFRESSRDKWTSFQREKFALGMQLKRSGSGWRVTRLNLLKDNK